MSVFMHTFVITQKECKSNKTHVHMCVNNLNVNIT